MSLDPVGSLFDDEELQTFEFEPELFTAIHLNQSEQEDDTTTPDSPPLPMHNDERNSNGSPYLRKQYVKVACQRCRIGHKSCSHSRPCQRCIDIGMSSSCCDDESGGHSPTRKSPPRTRKSNSTTNVIVVDFMGTIIRVPYVQRTTPHLIIVKQQQTTTIPSHLPIPRLVRTFNQSSK